MRKHILTAIGVFLAILINGISTTRMYAQQSVNPDEYMKAEDFTQILKDEWTYIKDATDEYLNSVASKSEFETSREYADRLARAKAAYVAKINDHIKEKKYDKRIFGVLFKATLVSYDADQQQYLITCPESVEAPYDIPTLQCILPRNPFVALTDSVNRGFRTSAIRLKIPLNYRWSVSRDEAKGAKANEANIYYQVWFVLDIHQDSIVKQAKMQIIPKRLDMIDLATHKVFWTVDIK